MKRIITFISVLLILLSGYSQAQEIRSMTVGAGYNKQSFVELTGGNEVLINNADWDIAFAVADIDQAGIFVNESAGSSMGNLTAQVELYIAASPDFEAVTDTAGISERIYNDEKSWHSGAFNTFIDENNPADYGWGIYNADNGQIEGSKVFLIKLRSGVFRKLEILSLSGTTYTFRYAPLNGANEQTIVLNTSDYSGANLVYFSLDPGTIKNLEPEAGYDLFYCRYFSPIPDPGTGGLTNYATTGILSGPQVLVAEAHVLPGAAVYEDYADSLSAETDIIGFDWKSFSGTSWSIDPQRVYFVLNSAAHLWKLRFIAFEGSLTGDVIYEITDLGSLSPVKEANSAYGNLGVYPNPANEQVFVVFTSQTAIDRGQLSVYDMMGARVFSSPVAIHSGLNSISIPTGKLPSGQYQVAIAGVDGTYSTNLIIQR